ncbi:MAG: hypothetical protein AAFN74_26330 [Myxococcota bacterium]
MLGLTIELFLVSLAIVGSSLALLIAALRRRSKTDLLPETTAIDTGRPHDYSWTPPSTSYAFYRFNPSHRTETPGGIESQSKTWRSTMRRLGTHLERRHVRRIVLVHGTFMGNDPFALVQQLNTLLAQLNPKLGQALLTLTKQQLNRLVKDSGNFSPQYAQLAKAALGEKIPCELFVWSSANHHVARLRAARDLILDLDKNLREYSSRDRTLMIGHSHAGQVFALATHLLAGSKIAHGLFEVLDRDSTSTTSRALKDATKTVRQHNLDFVTLGAPPRYGYCQDPKRRRVLHIVNHRGRKAQGGTVAGAFHTRGGDYIQQWGIAGSDLLAQTTEDRSLNEQLDAHLNIGADPAIWLENALKRPRVLKDGHTLLIDYCDASALTPNFHTTGLGHAIYTKQRMLRFNLEVIAEHLYGWTREE